MVFRSRRGSISHHPTIGPRREPGCIGPGDSIHGCGPGRLDDPGWTAETSRILDLLMENEDLESESESLLEAARIAGGFDDIILVLFGDEQPA